VLLQIFRKWLVSLMYDGIDVKWGFRCSSMYSDNFSVRLPLPAMLGLPGGLVVFGFSPSTCSHWLLPRFRGHKNRGHFILRKT
jgi:hypothetical protein